MNFHFEFGCQGMGIGVASSVDALVPVVGGMKGVHWAGTLFEW